MTLKTKTLNLDARLNVIYQNVYGLISPSKHKNIRTKLKKEIMHFCMKTHMTKREHEKLKRQGFENEFSSNMQEG